MKILPTLFLALALFSLLPCSGADEEPVSPVLSSLAEDLKGALESEPAVEVVIPEGYGGNTMYVRFKTREYMVYPSGKGGRLGRELVKDEGPDDEGFLLTVHVQKNGEVNQAVVPQTIRRPYWMTDLNVYPVSDSDQQLFAALSYRGWTDKDLLARIREVLKEVSVE